MLLRSAFSFGDILFYSDAKITALQENQKETLSLEERCRILQQENEELKKAGPGIHPAKRRYAHEQ